MEQSNITCKKCLEVKTPDSFHKDKNAKNGLKSSCRDCAKVYRKENLERITSYEKEYRSKNREKILLYEAEYREQNRDGLRGKSREHYAENKDSIRESQRLSYDPDKERRRKLKQVYNLSLESYNEMLENQNSCCAVCGGVNKNGYSLYVDHDHSCCSGEKSCGKCIRQLLCMKCNFGIGNFQDNPQLLRQAAEYIEKHTK